MGCIYSSEYDKIEDQNEWATYTDLNYSTNAEIGIKYISSKGHTQQSAFNALCKLCATKGVVLNKHESGRWTCGKVKYVHSRGWFKCQETRIGYSRVWFS